MMTTKDSPYLDWHWLATYVLGAVIVLLGAWARDLGATQREQDSAIVALRLTDERREEQYKNIVGTLGRIEGANLTILARIDSIRVGTIPCSGSRR